MTAERIILGLFAGVLVWLAVINARQFILPDAITISGIVAGLVLAWFFPSIHGKQTAFQSVIAAVQGLMVGAILVYGLSVAGKMLFGKQHVDLPPHSKVVLNQTSLVLPDLEIPYEKIFFRNSDQIEISAESARLQIIEANGDRIATASNVLVMLGPTMLRFGETSYDPASIASLEVVTGRVTLPREAIGFGLVKMAGFIGVFLGWKGVLFVLLCGGGASALAAFSAMAMKMWQNDRLDPATPLCIASLVWILLRAHLALAITLALLIGTVVSFILPRLIERLR